MPRLTGTIVAGGAPAEGAYVQIQNLAGDFQAEVRTDAAGRFVLHPIRGRWRLVCSEPSWSGFDGRRGSSVPRARTCRQTAPAPRSWKWAGSLARARSPSDVRSPRMGSRGSALRGLLRRLRYGPPRPRRQRSVHRGSLRWNATTKPQPLATGREEPLDLVDPDRARPPRPAFDAPDERGRRGIACGRRTHA